MNALTYSSVLLFLLSPITSAATVLKIPTLAEYANSYAARVFEKNSTQSITLKRFYDFTDMKSMKRFMIYFDNAATTLHKPACMARAMRRAMRKGMGNPGRGSHDAALWSSQILFDARAALAELFNIPDESRIALCYNATHAINLAVHGVIHPMLEDKRHVVLSTMEHNAVYRPIHVASQHYTIVPALWDGSISAEAVRGAIRPDTGLVAVTHASNVTGVVNDVKAIGAVCREMRVPFLCDASQTAGVLPIDVQGMNIDLLAMPGHKGLHGPTGTGALYVREGLTLYPLLQGGTGSGSLKPIMPEDMPDRLEAGTANVLGFAGLAAAAQYAKRHMGAHAVKRAVLMQALSETLHDVGGVKRYGVGDLVGIYAMTAHGGDTAVLAQRLSDEYGIATRGGLHCAPLAHRALGTIDTGILRLSLCADNTMYEVNRTVAALRKICAECER